MSEAQGRHSDEINMGGGTPRRHALRHIQSIPTHIEPASQDPFFVQGQLLRTLCAALTAAGFDSVRPSALEAFRADVEEYILHLLAVVQTSMASARRTTPVPQDMINALIAHNLEPADLSPYLSNDWPQSISTPLIPVPSAAEPEPPRLTSMLGADLMNSTHAEASYIPPHFLPLPSRHTWQSTAVFPDRESDPRNIRERTTQEGILAEQALRRLTSANRSSAHRRLGASDLAREKLWQDTVADVLGDDAASSQAVERMAAGDVIEVNHERVHWRRPAQHRVVRA